MPHIFAPLPAVLSVLLGAPADAMQPDSSTHAKPRLIAETTTLVPGETTWLGITFTIDEHWHIYWDGKGDTGQPVKAKFTLPPGFEVGDIVWPAPKRYVVADFSLDYVYEEKVTLLVPLKVPAGATSGQKAEIAAVVSWMECSEECRPGKSQVSISIPVGAAGDAAAKSVDASKFEESRKTIPRPVEESAKVVKSTFSADTVTLCVPGAAGLAFFPHRTSASLEDPMKQGATARDTMTFSVVPGSGDALVGILEVTRPSAQGAAPAAGPKVREYYTINLPRTSPGPRTQPSSPTR